MTPKNVCFLIVALIFSAETLAATQFGGAVTAAAGGGGRAINDDQEGASQNPALVPFSKGYHFRLTGLQNSGELGGHSYRVSVLDNMPDTALPAAVLYSEFRDSRNLTERDIQINVGNFVAPRSAIGFGLGFRTEPQINELGRAADRNDVYGVFGGQHYFTDELSVGGTLETSSAGVGLGYIYKGLIRMRADYSTTDVRTIGRRVEMSSIGGEAFLNQWLILRLGAAQVEEDLRTTWGIGFSGPRLKLSYAYAPFQWLRSPEYAHWLDLSMQVW